MRPRLSRFFLALLGSAIITMAMAQSSWALSGKQPIVVVLCKFTDQTDEPRDVQYFQDLFSETGAGENNLFDYWKDVSYGQLDLTGTVVKGWYTAQKTVGEFNALPRDQQIDVCAKEAVNDVDFSKFTGVYVVVNHKNLNGPLFGGPPPTTINGTSYGSLGRAATEWDQSYSDIQHESLHLFRMNHSRAITNNPAVQSDYGDSFDLGSCCGCNGTPNMVFRDQGQGIVGIPNACPFQGGPGLNAVQLLNAGWLAAPRIVDIGGNACTQQTVQLAALNHPEATGYLMARVPAAVPIFAGSAIPTTGDAYAVELRTTTGWDAGIGRDGVLVHLHGQDSYSYWISQSGSWGTFPNGASLMRAGDEYVDAVKQNFYLAVNSIDATAHTAVVTIGARNTDAQGTCKIDPALSYSGATSGDFNDIVTLAADLVVSGTTAPVPGATVNFKLGTQGCSATTNASGHAVCSFRLNQHPGAYNVTAAYAGDAAYDASGDASVGFTITQEESKVTYTGALTQDYHDAFTASASLVDPDDGVPIAGKTIVFTLGVGDTCSAVTNSAGVASCSITPTQASGTYSITASFAGDIDYKASSAVNSFIITREETTTTYTGPVVILQGHNVTLTGRLLEDGVTPIQGRSLTLRLGAQSCTGVTSATGDASCTLSVAVALGPQTLGAEFAGDAFYLPSSDATKQAIVFAFPARGAFVLGDLTVAAATPSTSLTWWSYAWTAFNSLSSNGSNSSFKGFAGTLRTSPPACGSAWTTTPGNSPPPVGGVPSYMGVLVASSANQSGNTFSGNTVKIVVVLTQPGYGPNPGSPGTGTIVATYCQ